MHGAGGGSTPPHGSNHLIFIIMTTQVTTLEMSVLDAIQNFTANEFSSDNGNWAYVNEISDTIGSSRLRALITTLCIKGILSLETIGGEDGAYVEVSDNYYRNTGNYTDTGSPEIEFINLQIK